MKQQQFLSISDWIQGFKLYMVVEEISCDYSGTTDVSADNLESQPAVRWALLACIRYPVSRECHGQGEPDLITTGYRPVYLVFDWEGQTSLTL